MRLMMRPETKKRIPNGTITAAAAIAIPKKCTQPWEKRKRKKEREIHRKYFEKWDFIIIIYQYYGNK